MKKLLVFILLLSSYASAQFGTVSATITDGAGQTFNNGTYKVELVPAFGFGNPVRTDTGLPVTPTQVSGVLDGTGSFAGVVLTRTDFIGPAGSLWKFTVCPDATSGCFSYTTTITTAAPSLTAPLSAAAGTIVVGTQFIKNIIPTAYASTELFGMTKGSLYWNTASNHLFGYNGAAWNDLTATPVASCGTVNNLCKSDGAGAFINSALVENGSRVVSTVPFAVTDSNSVPLFTGATTTNGGMGVDPGRVWIYGAGTRRAVFNTAGNQFILGLSDCYTWTTNADVGLAGADTYICKQAPRVVRIGNVASAGPTANILQVGEDGTGANVAGSNGTVRAGNGTGNAGGGSLIFQTSIAHGADSVLDTFTTAMTIDASQNTNIVKLKVNGSQAFTGVQGTTGTNVAAATGAFVSGNGVKTDANGNFIDAGVAIPTGTLNKECANVTSVTNTTTTTAVQTQQTCVIAANEMTAGSQFQITIKQDYTNGDTTLTKLGVFGIGVDGSLVGASCTSPSVSPAASVSFIVRLYITVLTTGASGTIIYTTECFTTGASNSANIQATNQTTGTTTIDTTTTHTIQERLNQTTTTDSASTMKGWALIGIRY